MFRKRLPWKPAAGLVCLVGLALSAPAFGQAPLADPTRPAFLGGGVKASRDTKAAAWTLTSTLISPERRVAVINHRVVQVGQTVDGAKLVAVEPGKALLRRGNKNIQLTLAAGAVKRKAKTGP